MTAPSTWKAAIADSLGNLRSPVKVLPLILLSGIQTGTVPQSAPTDANPPPTANVVGDGATQDLIGSWTPPLGSVRCDGYRQVSLSLEVYGSSGSVSATFQPYFFDGVRWCACADTITVTTSATSSSPGARQRHDIVVENDFGFMLVITAISGSGATAAAYATFRDLVIGQK